MNATTKIDLLDHLNCRVQRHLDIAVSKFQNLDESTLMKPSSNGGWSIAQCLDHLNSYGDFYLPEIEKALKSSEGSPQGKFRSGWLGGYFAKMMEPSDKKYPALKGHIPPLNLDAYAVVIKFISQQEDLLKYLQLAAHADLNFRVPTSISSLIKLKLGDVFQFLIAHNERHVQQALRNL